LLQLLHKPVAKETQRIHRSWRVAFRFLVTTMWTLLPLAGEKINSLQFLGIVTGTCYMCLFLEIYGQAPAGSKVVEWKDDWDTGYEEVHGGDRRMIRTIYGCF
jgi:hypothetical protein